MIFIIKDTFTNRFNRIMRERNYRQVDLVNKTKEVMKMYIKDYDGDGIDKTLINKYLKGIAIPKQDNIFILAKALNVSETWLMGYDDKPNIDNGEYIEECKEMIKIPLIGRVPAGTPIEAIEDVLGYEEIPADWVKHGEVYFALKINGDSMLPDYKTNDIIIVKQQPNCESGDDCVVMVNGDDATFKRVVKQEKSIILKPLNNEYEPYYFDEYDIISKPVTILGVAVEVRRKLGGNK